MDESLPNPLPFMRLITRWLQPNALNEVTDLAARTRYGTTSVVDRSLDLGESTRDAENLMTRDIPLPPRSVRVGLSTASTTSTPGTTSTANTTATASTPDASATETTGVIGAVAAATGSARPSGRKRSRHRAGPPSTLKARTALVAVAAGAAAAAVAGSGTTDIVTAQQAPETGAAPGPALVASSADLDGGIAPAAAGAEMDGFAKQLAVGKQLAAAAAAREAAARKPLFASPIPLGAYSFTSGYAMRWGSFHGGLDLAAPLGTPIHAVTDGVVVEAGPASGYGNWIQVKADDGTITMYGHMASSGVLVSKGQKVTAGDVIGLVGSEGFSTGPHVHFEVWKNGTTKIDPAPWLAQNGVRLSAYGS